MTEQTAPLVPTILFVAAQHHPWQLPAIEHWTMLYHTAQTVRCKTPEGAVTKHQHQVYCLPDDADWARVQETYAAFQATLDTLATALRDLGTYNQRLLEAGGINTAPNPLVPSVICTPDPDGYYAPSLVFGRTVPDIRRFVVERHTPLMIRLAEHLATISSQKDHFVCPTDDDWNRIEALHHRACQAEQAWNALLAELGTYQEASADGRYANRLFVIQDSAQPPATWPALPLSLRYGHHRNAMSGGITHIWRPAPNRRAPQRYETLCHIVMTEPPRPAAFTQAGLRLCSECRHAVALLANETQKETSMASSKEASPIRPRDDWHNLPPKLTRWKWETHPTTGEVCLRAPEGWATKYYTKSNRAIAEALRRVNSQPKSIAAEAEQGPVIQEINTVTPHTEASTLSVTLQDLARRYVVAREQAGTALLEMAATLAEARALAKHGEWYIFLQTIGTSTDHADRLLDIHDQATHNSAFADAIRRNFLSPTTAALLARPSTPPVVIERTLNAPQPPTKRQVEEQIRKSRNEESKPRTGAGSTLPANNDDREIAAARKLLADLPTWSVSEYPRIWREAYAHAREVRDPNERQALFAEIDAALDRTANQDQEGIETQPIHENQQETGLSTTAEQHITNESRLALNEQADLAEQPAMLRLEAGNDNLAHKQVPPLTAGVHARCVSLTSTIRTALITDQVANAREATLELLQALIEPGYLALPPFPVKDEELFFNQMQRAYDFLEQEGFATVAALLRAVGRFVTAQSIIAEPQATEQAAE